MVVFPYGINVKIVPSENVKKSVFLFSKIIVIAIISLFSVCHFKTKCYSVSLFFFRIIKNCIKDNYLKIFIFHINAKNHTPHKKCLCFHKNINIFDSIQMFLEQQIIILE